MLNRKIFFFSKDFLKDFFFQILKKGFFENTYFYSNNNSIPELPSYHNLLWYLNIIRIEHIIRLEHVFLSFQI